MTRQQMFRESHLHFRQVVKQQYGNGLYSWSEGMTRRSARKIATRLARTEYIEMKAKASSTKLEL